MVDTEPDVQNCSLRVLIRNGLEKWWETTLAKVFLVSLISFVYSPREFTDKHLQEKPNSEKRVN